MPTTRQAVRKRLKVRGRDGQLALFDPAKIERAIAAAAREVGRGDLGSATSLAESVTTRLTSAPHGEIVDIETIQDLVEQTLAAAGLDEIARAYILYRHNRAELRLAKALLGVHDELKLSLAAVTVLRERYLLRDSNDHPAEAHRIETHPIESTGGMMDRVASFVAGAEDSYRKHSSSQWADRFAGLLRSLEFLPNSPTLMNAGTELGVLSGCFVLPIDDSIHSIFTTLAHAAEIQRAGGGTGYSFGRLRPAGDPVTTTGGTASGPLSFLHLYDTAAAVVAQGGRRRGACMAVLDVAHPDIYEFVAAKANSSTALAQFNLSVGVSNAFLRAVERGGQHRLINPRTGKTVTRVPAVELFTAICEAAHACGDPGLVFLDTINRSNPLPARGRIEATNPCGEVPLLPYESCNLGSINLARMTGTQGVEWDRLATVTAVAVRFLDDVIDVSRYPFPELGEAARAGRKIGLGVMGLAELLATLGIPYDSVEGVRLAGRIMRHIQRAAHATSARLAEQRGAFPAFASSRFADSTPLRNAQLTSVAPTGTISLIAGTTAGIEPMFAIAFTRAIVGRHLLEVNPVFDRLARDRGLYRDELIAEIAHRGGVRGYSQVPADIRAAFPTAAEIAPEWHLRMQAAIQRHVDAAVSKTINLPASATAADIHRIYLAAWKAKVKGITVYRYGSRQGQVLTFAAPTTAVARADTDFAGGCAGRNCEF